MEITEFNNRPLSVVWNSEDPIEWNLHVKADVGRTKEKARIKIFFNFYRVFKVFLTLSFLMRVFPSSGSTA